VKLDYRVGDRVYRLELTPVDGGYRAWLDGRPFSVQVIRAEPGVFHLEVDGWPVRVDWAADGPLRWVALNGRTYLLDRRASSARRASGPGGGEQVLRAPMPGQVRAVEVAAGQAVETGQTLVIVEAMKMEIRVRAPADGLVARLLVEAGQSVDKGQVLVELA
jgi:acetyl/propionyl-CoA carboxylase alpha subunit